MPSADPSPTLSEHLQRPSPLWRAVGVDIGGTKMAIAAVDVASHHLIARRTLPTEAAAGFPRAVERLTRAIEEVLEEAGWPHSELAGIGIGCAGPVDPAQGLINNPFTLEGWDRCDIVTPLRKRFGVGVRLENDADAAVIGEAVAGSGRGATPLVMLTFGTGVGGASIHGGTLGRGARGEHPELGHLPVRPDGPPCYCGIRGCLESLASGTAVAEAGRALGLPDARAVFQAADAGDPRASAIVEQAVQAAARAAWAIAHALLPARLILGGGIMETEFERFAIPMRHLFQQATQFPQGAVQVVPSELGNDAGVVGAAHLALPPWGQPA